MDQRQLKIVLKLQDEASRELRKVTGDINMANDSTNSWSNTFQTVERWAKRAAIAVGGATIAAIGYGVKTAATLQTAQVGLTTLLGDAEKAAKTMDRLKIEAARTPFELPGLSQAVQLLSSVTHDGDRSIDILLDVGEALAAMGKGQAELDRIIVNLQQVAAVGHAATIDIKQFAFAGIPIYEMLQEQTGLAGESLSDFIAQGGVTFELLTNMFDKANDEGGRFFGAFQNQSGTFTQALSNMKDSMSIFFAEAVTSTGIFQTLTDLMVKFSNLISASSFDDFINKLDEQTGLVTLLKDSIKNITESLIELQPTLEGAIKLFTILATIAIADLVKMIEWTITGWAGILKGIQQLSDFIVGTFLDVWDSVIDKIEKVINVTGKLVNSFKNTMSSAGSFVSNIGTGIINAIVPGRANGGPVSAGSPYVVGERGPELFVPRNSGSIIPNGAGGINVSVVVNGDVSGTELIEKVQNAIMNSLRANTKIAI